MAGGHVFDLEELLRLYQVANFCHLGQYHHMVSRLLSLNPPVG